MIAAIFGTRRRHTGHVEAQISLEHVFDGIERPSSVSLGGRIGPLFVGVADRNESAVFAGLVNGCVPVADSAQAHNGHVECHEKLLGSVGKSR